MGGALWVNQNNSYFVPQDISKLTKSTIFLSLRGAGPEILVATWLLKYTTESLTTPSWFFLALAEKRVI